MRVTLKDAKRENPIQTTQIVEFWHMRCGVVIGKTNHELPT